MSRAAASLARRAGVPVVADVDAPGPGVEALLAVVDFPLVSRSFAETLSLDGTVRGGLDRLVQLGARMAVATLGDRGCLARIGDREIACPAFPIAPRDTTGAGDVFHAAFAWGVLEGFSGERLLRTANAAAALACRGLGAQGDLPTRARTRGVPAASESQAPGAIPTFDRDAPAPERARRSGDGSQTRAGGPRAGAVAARDRRDRGGRRVELPAQPRGGAARRFGAPAARLLDDDLEALADAYRQEIAAHAARYASQKTRRAEARDRAYFDEQVREFENVQKHSARSATQAQKCRCAKSI